DKAEEKDKDKAEEKDKVAEDAPGEYDRTASAPIPKGKWDVRHAEKTWGLQMKGFKYVEKVRVFSGKRETETSYHLLLEFTKDLPLQELYSLRETLRSSSPTPVNFVVIDEDSVPVAKNDGIEVKGEVTGVKGDAFWLVVKDWFNSLMKDLGGI